MKNLFLYALAVLTLVIGFFLTWLATLGFIIPTVFLRYIFNNNWDVLAFYWAFSSGLLALGYALLFFNDEYNKTRATYNYVYRIAKANLVYTLLTNFAGIGVILTGAYSISFAYNYPLGYAVVWLCVFFCFYFIVNTTKKPPLKKKLK